MVLTMLASSDAAQSILPGRAPNSDHYPLMKLAQKGDRKTDSSDIKHSEIFSIFESRKIFRRSVNRSVCMKLKTFLSATRIKSVANQS